MIASKEKLKEAKNFLIEIILTILTLALGLLSLAGIIRLLMSAVSSFIVDDWYLLSISLLGFSAIVVLFLVLVSFVIDFIGKDK